MVLPSETPAAEKLRTQNVISNQPIQKIHPENNRPQRLQTKVPMELCRTGPLSISVWRVVATTETPCTAAHVNAADTDKKKKLNPLEPSNRSLEKGTKGRSPSNDTKMNTFPTIRSVSKEGMAWRTARGEGDPSALSAKAVKGLDSFSGRLKQTLRLE